mgnify:CR=1 FL=1
MKLFQEVAMSFENVARIVTVLVALVDLRIVIQALMRRSGTIVHRVELHG